ncbi:MAG: glycosyltransferase family 2 protein [Isosphaeraceae bacterium]
MDEARDRDLQKHRRELEMLRAENLMLRELFLANAKAKQQATALRNQLDEIRGSRAWKFVVKARGTVRIAGRIASWARQRRDSLRRAVAPSRPAPAGEGTPRPGPCDVWIRPHGEASPLRSGRSFEPKVSVIVPNFNHAPYLEERLRSIFGQSYLPYEILFLDDASRDASVAVARRLAEESPVPFRLVVNETNSGSTFRQWLRGIDLAAGDLVWIAESDDACRPELLERLVAEFRDPGVMLAFCQSSVIGSDGRRYAEDYLFATEDLSPTRWRSHYVAPGAKEVETALSQRNTIPNASAVVFRRPAELEEREDLERLRLGGDWLFYAMRIRRGKIAFVPEPLNAHRHHERTVRHAFERAVLLFEEQLAVKARIFESFPVSASAISGSVARSLVEYIDRLGEMVPRLAMTEHPRLAAGIGRLRAVFGERIDAVRDMRVLLVVSGLADEPPTRAMIDLANGLAGRLPVFVANALPGVLDPRMVARFDGRVVWIEGTPGIQPWTWDGDPRVDPSAVEAMSPRRTEVLRELAAFHRMDVVHSSGAWADRLVAAAALPASIRRFTDAFGIASHDRDVETIVAAYEAAVLGSRAPARPPHRRGSLVPASAPAAVANEERP